MKHSNLCIAALEVLLTLAEHNKQLCKLYQILAKSMNMGDRAKAWWERELEVNWTDE